MYNRSVMRRIVVDIDNTLWNLAPVLQERLKAANPDVPPSPLWYKWDFWIEYLPDKVIYRVLREIHLDQERYTPYPESRGFLLGLKEMDCHIIIASHREQEAFDATIRWLEKNELAFDEIHLSHDKTVLFDNCWAVVDDSPIILEKARKAHIIRAGLRNPWNEAEDHPLFDSLTEVLAYLKTMMASSTLSV